MLDLRGRLLQSVRLVGSDLRVPDLFHREVLECVDEQAKSVVLRLVDRPGAGVQERDRFPRETCGGPTRDQTAQ